ncbi:MAG: alpha/beta hydrolase [Gammaproteobacteria bacterium]|jgi:pimeloyl-ACP methyl ester carboxylesterase|nr:alpha/beta hydrolase [Gammaproteobacteria bacterium]
MAHEISITLKGQKIAAKVWNDKSGIPTLALHGWLDNAASFDKLAPLLPDLHIVAIDLPGHGFSEHIPQSANLHIIDITATAILLANHLGWDKFALLGHSLGACINSMIAGALQDRILWAMMIDALGPITSPPHQAPMQFRAFMKEMITKPNKKPPTYEAKDHAVEARLKVNPMHESSCRIIIERGLKQLPDGLWTWRTDPRLLMPSALHLSEDHVLAFLEDITSPVCLIRPEQGFPFPQDILQKRIKTVKNAQVFRIPGQHHIHLDDAQAVANCMHSFIRELI